MPNSPAEVLYDFISHLGQQGASHIGKRMDRAAGIMPPPAFQVPAFSPPPFPGIAPMPQVPAMAPMPAWAPTAVGAGVGGAVATAEKAPATTPTPVKPDAEDEQDIVEGSYSDQVADGIACLACTRGHLNGLLAAIESATKAVDAGDERKARQQYAMAAAEIDAMTAIDWSPDKLEASPPEDVAIIESVRDCVMDIRAQIPTPEAIGLALGSAKENARFATSPQFTARDKAEIEARLRIIDKEGNALERGILLESDDTDAAEAATALREARHTLDDAKAHDTLYAVATHKQTIRDLETAAIALTPLPTTDQLKAVGTLCQSCSDTFYQAYFLHDAEDA